LLLFEANLAFVIETHADCSQSNSGQCKEAVPCLVILQPLCKIFLAAPGTDPTFWVSDTDKIFKKISDSKLCILV